MPISSTLFSLRGRLRRRDWWLSNLVLQAAMFAITLAGEILRVGATPDWLFLLRPPYLFLQLIVLWPALALAVKRAHDRGKAGRAEAVVLLLVTALPYVPGHLLPAEAFHTLRWPLTAGATAGPIYLLITLGLLDGTLTDNRYGPNPKLATT